MLQYINNVAFSADVLHGRSGEIVDLLRHSRAYIVIAVTYAKDYILNNITWNLSPPLRTYPTQNKYNTTVVLNVVNRGFNQGQFERWIFISAARRNNRCRLI